jgi:hypothetical protein
MLIIKGAVFAGAVAVSGAVGAVGLSLPAQGDVVRSGSHVATRISLIEQEPRGACLVTLPLNQKMCVDDVLKDYCFRYAGFATGTLYEDMTCRELKEQGYY